MRLDNGPSTKDTLEYISGQVGRILPIVAEWLAYPRELQARYGVVPVIAGGAIRDLILGREVKDIDVFLTRSDILRDAYGDRKIWKFIESNEGWPQPMLAGSEYVDADSLVDKTPFDKDNMVLKERTKVKHNRHIQAVYEYNHEMIAIPYNFIYFDHDYTASEVVNDFDMGLCMVGFNVYGTAVISRAFAVDVHTQRMTLYREESKERALTRHARISVKYPWPLVDKEGNTLQMPTPVLIKPNGSTHGIH